MKHATQAQRVTFLNTLRTIVSKHCPVNKVGVPLVSDWDLVWCSDEERASAMEKAGIAQEASHE